MEAIILKITKIIHHKALKSIILIKIPRVQKAKCFLGLWVGMFLKGELHDKLAIASSQVHILYIKK
jgi:hypothetical protein